ncbi:MAG: PAS domain-containing protein [Proteobacteria bacterium]|nr:PAS domain-containing protein [Pseudomonadota bacterium]
MANDYTTGTGSSLSEFHTRVVQDGYTYWRSKAKDGQLPARSDINPVDIPRLMPHVVILDVRREPVLDFRYRLIGTYVVEHLCADRTGSWLSEIEHQTAPIKIWQNCKQVVETDKAFLAGTPYVGPHNALCRSA